VNNPVLVVFVALWLAFKFLPTIAAVWRRLREHAKRD